MNTLATLNKPVRIAVIGASGYVGSELMALLARHHGVELVAGYVSANSQDRGKALSQLYPKLRNVVDMPLLPLTEDAVGALAQQVDAVCLCTEHAVAAQLASQLHKQGVVIFDLSGAHRLTDSDKYLQFYGFQHPAPELLSEAVYGLAEWHAAAIKRASLVAVPGCYPTAALLALKPVAHLLNDRPVIINAVSGVTGAGRTATQKTHGAELSLQGYGVFAHRHQPEIQQHSALNVLFTPHLANFKRGILATIYAELVDDVDRHMLQQAFQCYDNADGVRVSENGLPAIKDVEGSGYCDIGWHQQGQQLIVFSAIDNLLKGAASQAVQCINLRFSMALNQGVPL